MTNQYLKALEEYRVAEQMFEYATEPAFIDTAIYLMEAACIKIHAWKSYSQGEIELCYDEDGLNHRIVELRDHRGVSSPLKWIKDHITNRGGRR